MGNNTREEIGLRISKLRESLKLSQGQLALELEKIGLKVRRETVTQWENGTRDLKTEYTIRLAELFGVSCDYILRGIDAENISVAEETGLSNEAITQIKTFSNILRLSSYFLSFRGRDNHEHDCSHRDHDTNSHIDSYLLTESGCPDKNSRHRLKDAENRGFCRPDNTC